MARGRPTRSLAEARRVAREPEALDPDRVDLRDLTAVTVDPPTRAGLRRRASRSAARATACACGCTSPTWRYHVRAGGALDREARRRALPVYVPGQVEPMLPHELSSGVCSLQEGRDRRAVTVEVLLDAQLRPGEPRFYRSLIRSRRPPHATTRRTRSSRAARATREAGELLELADGLAQRAARAPLRARRARGRPARAVLRARRGPRRGRASGRPSRAPTR